MNTHYRKPDQIIHPYYFAKDENDESNYVQKRTCLWLKGLKPLERKTFLDKPAPKYICQGENVMERLSDGAKVSEVLLVDKKEEQEQEARHFKGLQRQWRNNGEVRYEYYD